ncbi:hemolysin-III related-domain-containing protein [Jimgerdemannia flammicorona]|uniref:Hemolysin-III related-domain-containing protein n=1 Tax=Jimgerdemannia flammicorona TaxID=994334 RepID=A0A433Q1Q2_9FUNG|nr:hemolysin-III related-domain-containing protein [Jimgerdemannia flammicorona]
MTPTTTVLTHRHARSLSLSISGSSDPAPATTTEHAHSCRDGNHTHDDEDSLATQLLHTVNTKLRQIEDADATGILRYVDDHVHETWDTAKAAMVGAQRLLKFEELPEEWQENKYVLTGYRFCTSSSQCLRTIFAVHNETMNIWSHLIGFIFFAGLGVYTFNFHHDIASSTDRLVFLLFFLAAAKCLVCSTLYHTFICHHQHNIKTFAATLDYIGIAALITASVLVMEYYGFYCAGAMRDRYMSVTALFGLAGLVLPFFQWWDTPRCRPLRIAVFLTMGMSGSLPLVHLVITHGFFATGTFVGPMITSVVMYLTGVAICDFDHMSAHTLTVSSLHSSHSHTDANRFPEKMFPGRFDWAGMTSHAIWHVFVCLGIFHHYKASLHFHRNRYGLGCLMA